MILVESIPQCVVYHGIHQSAIVHSITVTAIHHRIGSHGHVFHTACHYDIGIAGLDHLRRHVDTVQTGTAYYVNCYRRSLHRKPCLDGCLTRNVLSEACLNNTAHVNMINLICRNACSLQRFLDYDGTKYRCRRRSQSSAHFTDSGTTSTR